MRTEQNGRDSSSSSAREKSGFLTPRHDDDHCCRHGTYCNVAYPRFGCVDRDVDCVRSVVAHEFLGGYNIVYICIEGAYIYTPVTTCL